MSRLRDAAVGVGVVGFLVRHTGHGVLQLLTQLSVLDLLKQCDWFDR